MAQYKVPQDVEADDKLLGPFNFRQFVYLLISGGLIALAVGLFQLFPLLAIIPIPFTIFFLALALPLRKDQPMETYLAALLSYYTKPRTKKWIAGQRDTTILITAPKVVEESRTRDISGEEATHRLSFLADIVDSQGFSIKGVGATSPMREDLVAEANATPDMFEAYQSQVINRVIDQDKMSRHNDAVKEMRNAIERNTDPSMLPSEEPAKIIKREDKEMMAEEPSEPENVMANPAPIAPPIAPQPEIPVFTQEEPRFSSFGEEAVLKPDMEIENSDVIVRPEVEIFSERAEKVRIPGAERPGEDIEEPEPQIPVPQAQNNPTNPVNNSIMELAHNEDFSVATIAKEANRINRKEKGEIFVSLH